MGIEPIRIGTPWKTIRVVRRFGPLVQLHQKKEVGASFSPLHNVWTGQRYRIVWRLAWPTEVTAGSMPASKAGKDYAFDRYCCGQKMAEGVVIANAPSLDSAIRQAVSLANGCPGGGAIVLVLHRPTDGGNAG